MINTANECFCLEALYSGLGMSHHVATPTCKGNT